MEGAARERRVRRREPGLAATLAGAGLLVTVGFALGVVVGLVMEEPDLLFDYVAGRTTAVPLEPVASETRPDVAAAPPVAGVAAQQAEPVPAVSPAPETAAPAVPSEPAAVEPPPARGFAVQVGAFADAAAAEQLARRLRERGWPVYVSPATADTQRWRVRIGPLPTRADADEVAGRVQREERLGTWVLAESPY
jgi:cell division septation protein DedD